MPIVGKYLKKLREQKGIPLDVIYHQTRIPISTLDKLEKNDFRDFPRPYIASFIKSYGKEIGISDAHLKEIILHIDHDDKIIQIFEQMAPNVHSSVFSDLESDVESVRPSSLNLDDMETYSQPIGKSVQVKTWETYFHAYKWVGLGVLLTIVIIWVFIYSFNQDVMVDEKPISTIPFEAIEAEVKQEIKKSEVPKTDIKPSSTMVVKSSSITAKNYDQIPFKILTIKATDSVWVGYRTEADSVIRNMMLTSEKARNIRGKQFSLTIGRAENVSIELDQKPVTLPKTSGVINNFIIE